VSYRFARSSLSFILIALLAGCSLEGFEVTPCSAKGRPAFRIHAIPGWFRDYQPRPGLIVIQAWDGSGAAWSVRENSLDERPARKVVLYGQHLAGWVVEEAPHALRPGMKYHLYMTDGGHAAQTDFVADEPVPDC